MAINLENAFETSEDGYLVRDNDGNVLFYITFGTGSPVGTQAPVRTIYVDENSKLWRKFGAGVNDWSKITDHGELDGLLDDDHLQYLTEGRHDSLAADNPHSVSFTQAVAADPGTNITSAEAEQLTNNSNSDSLHQHDHGALQGLGDDDHPQYTRKDTLTTKGDLYARNSTSPTRLGVGTNTFALVADSVAAVGMAWKRLLAAWVSFDPTGLLNFQPTDDTVQKALARFGNFSITDLTEAEGKTQNALDTTTSNGWVSRAGFPFLTTGVKTAGKFSIRWSTEVGQTTKNRNYGLLVRWRPEGGAWTTLSSVELANSRDNNFIMQGGFKEVTLPTDSKIEVDMQFGQTTGGGTAQIQNSALEVRRISS